MFCLLASCNSKPSLQEYFVKNSENKNFIQVDVSSSVLNIDENKLSVAETAAIKSFKKMNILAFKLDANNKGQFEAEKHK